MNILFLSLIKFNSFEEHNIYTDLLRELIECGHTIYAVCPAERRYKKKTNIQFFGHNAILTVKTFNIQKTNIVEKGIGTLAIKSQFVRAIKKHFHGYKFDLILYPTPPITLCGVVEYFKKRDNAKTYLMLKDIFPQNAVDLGMMKKTGLKGLFYTYFRKQEKRLYSVSDRIGCMSPANKQYILKHNPETPKEKIEVFPNCVEIQNLCLTNEKKQEIRQKYNLPLDKTIFVYGGNLGKPQNIPFIIECLKAANDIKPAFFVIVGDGTDFNKLDAFLTKSTQTNFKLMKKLPVNEFNEMVACCDVGLIFLDYRFTIPNYPSRLLSYMQAGLPVLACTDISTDIGQEIVGNGYGWWCESNDPSYFKSLVDSICNSNIREKGQIAFSRLTNSLFNVKKCAKRIYENSIL